MKVRVLLTDVFDLTTPNAMDRRIEYAFGVDGQDFWDRFFSCNKVHPNDRMVYLLTEHQMWILHTWLARKSCDEKIRKNLDFSRQSFFSEHSVQKSKNPYGYDKIHVCHIKHGADNRLELSRVSFGPTPSHATEKGHIYFFDEIFEEDRPTIGEEEREKTLTELLSMRQAIEKEAGCPVKKDEKWLCYLGDSGIFGKEHASIEYCGDIKNCLLDKYTKKR